MNELFYNNCMQYRGGIMYILQMENFQLVFFFCPVGYLCLSLTAAGDLTFLKMEPNIYNIVLFCF